MATVKNIKQDTVALLQRKRPLTYEGIVKALHDKHPETHTTVKTVQWYASRMRAAGETVRVKLVNDKRNWAKRPEQKAQ